MKSNEVIVNQEQMKNLAYSMEELFTNETLEMLKDPLKYRVTQMFSLYDGLCYSIQKLEKVYIKEYFSFELFVKNNMDYNVFLHEPEETILVSTGIRPYPLLRVAIKSNQTHKG